MDIIRTNLERVIDFYRKKTDFKLSSSEIEDYIQDLIIDLKDHSLKNIFSYGIFLNLKTDDTLEIFLSTSVSEMGQLIKYREKLVNNIAVLFREEEIDYISNKISRKYNQDVNFVKKGIMNNIFQPLFKEKYPIVITEEYAISYSFNDDLNDSVYIEIYEKP